MANQKLYSYDPNGMAMTFGPNIISGFGDGTFITVERASNSWNKKVGTDGVVTRSKSNDKSGTITVVLSQGCEACDTLSALQVADEQNNLGVVPFSLRDTSGRTVVTAAQCWLTKPPTVEFSRESTDRTYVFESNSIDIYLGGNTQNA